MNKSNSAGILLALCLVALLWWGSLSVWASKMVEVTDNCDKASESVIPLKLDIFCGEQD